VNQIVKGITSLAAEHGCKVTDVKRGKHFKFYLDTPSGKQILVCSVSASDRKAITNNVAILRRWGKKP
jgi:hypothetical protein